MQLTARHRLHRVQPVALVVVLPGAGVPHDDVAAAVLACRDDTLEVVVLHGMVLDVEGRAAHRGVEGGPLRHCPARQDPGHLEPEVVVQPAGSVSLDDEPAPDRQAPDRDEGPGRLPGTGEVPHPAVGVEPIPVWRSGSRHTRVSRQWAGLSRRLRTSSRRTWTRPSTTRVSNTTAGRVAGP